MFFNTHLFPFDWLSIKSSFSLSMISVYNLNRDHGVTQKQLYPLIVSEHSTTLDIIGFMFTIDIFLFMNSQTMTERMASCLQHTIYGYFRSITSHFLEPLILAHIPCVFVLLGITDWQSSWWYWLFEMKRSLVVDLLLGRYLMLYMVCSHLSSTVIFVIKSSKSPILSRFIITSVLLQLHW